MMISWQSPSFDYHGKYFALENVQLISEPVHVPIIMGGNSDRALARAAVVGDGWYSSGTPSFDEARRLRDEPHRLRAEKGLDDPFRATSASRPTTPPSPSATGPRASTTSSSG